MHFLCLHGAGTNNQIFEKQTAMLRRELGSEHTFEFVEGTVACEMSYDIRGVADEAASYFQYYRTFNSKSFKQAVDDLGKYIREEGPFDGIMAFSMGTSLAAAYLIQLESQLAGQLATDSQQMPISCAIFFCGRKPYVDAGFGHEDFIAEFNARDQAIPLISRTLTTHVWGSNDRKEPGQAPLLFDVCDQRSRQRVVHDGGHEVPSPRMAEALYDSARAIQEMLAKVEKGGWREAAVEM